VINNASHISNDEAASSSSMIRVIIPGGVRKANKWVLFLNIVFEQHLIDCIRDITIKTNTVEAIVA
jgi:hypothetical protein